MLASLVDFVRLLPHTLAVTRRFRHSEIFKELTFSRCISLFFSFLLSSPLEALIFSYSSSFRLLLLWSNRLLISLSFFSFRWFLQFNIAVDLHSGCRFWAPVGWQVGKSQGILSKLSNFYSLIKTSSFSNLGNCLYRHPTGISRQFKTTLCVSRFSRQNGKFWRFFINFFKIDIL